MRKLLFVVVVAAAFFVGTRVTKGTVQQDVGVQNNCSVPKGFGDFKAMTGAAFVFENPNTGTIKVLTCKGNSWVPDAQITRSDN